MCSALPASSVVLLTCLRILEALLLSIVDKFKHECKCKLKN